jgi:chromosome partitioning protein
MADLTVIPIDTSKYALLGLTHLLKLIGSIMDEHTPDMVIMALSTMFVPRQRIDQEIRKMVIKRFEESNVFNTVIPRAVAVNQAAMSGKSIFEIEPLSVSAAAFYEFAQEIKGVLNDGEEQESDAGVGERTEGA